MSGLLRRIKRSRPAEAGEPHPEGRAAAAEGAAPTAETPSEAPTQIVPPGGGSAESDTAEAVPASGDDPSQAPQSLTGGEGAGAAEAASAGSAAAGGTPAAAPGSESATSEAGAASPRKRRRLRLFRRRARELPPTAAPAPVLLADPNVPAGVDPAAAPMRPPSGRRGRLRRRLRYLRRARELMLRDLGGLMYEIHRTGGGDVEAHKNVVGAKVQRIAGVDAEAHALENALAAPRSDAVVFEPGIGGTCANCGELYGSDARFCAHCGTATGAVAELAPGTSEIVPEPERRAFWRRAARPAAVSDGESAAQKPAEDASAKPETDQPTSAMDAAATPDERATQSGGDEPAAPGAEREGSGAPSEHASGDGPTARDDETAGRDAPNSRHDDQREDPPATGDGGESTRDPFDGGRNGRPEDHRGPGSTDPLFSRERS